MVKRRISSTLTLALIGFRAARPGQTGKKGVGGHSDGCRKWPWKTRIFEKSASTKHSDSASQRAGYSDSPSSVANPRAQEMLSIWGDYEGRLVPEVIRSPEIDQALRDAANSDGIVVRELEVQAEKKRILLMHASGFPEANSRTGTVAVFHDVSEMRRVDQMRRDFTANASHELRTPLTSIMGFAGTLASYEVSAEEHSQYLNVIVRNAQRMSSLIDDLLTLSRIFSAMPYATRTPERRSTSASWSGKGRSRSASKISALGSPQRI